MQACPDGPGPQVRVGRETGFLCASACGAGTKLMKSQNSVLVVIVLVTVGLFLMQTHNLNRLREDHRLAQDEARRVKTVEREAERLKSEIASMREQIEALSNEVEQWRTRYREKETVNLRLREDLRRSATEIREMGASLDLMRRKGSK